MIREERLEKIVEVLEEKLFMSVSDLANLFKVTEITIRRDLKTLEKENLIVRFHGGAKIDSQYFDREDSYTRTVDLNASLKIEISKIAASSINENDVIFIGAGTTTYYLADYLKDINFPVVVVTNSQVVVDKLSFNMNIKIICTGGNFQHRTKSYIGNMAENNIDGMKFNKAYIGANGIDTEGVYTSSIESSSLYKKIINNSRLNYILTDHTKFNRIDFISFADLNDISLVFTDDNISERIFNKYIKKISIITPSIYEASEVK